ncbi:glycoside hydrolase family 105 protein [Plenodomus tracheiphilus IPT5]|uniref:Glycoside hydrolase family 105 protein n=1 Tax=Plenodomus tracheiphilus IPT5 TaxID=1408161 RepID=A0A6A7APK0_9PLEO|nr:glycoside hydrolase family 105 protein [Plenodomus tracheiphilus IPT5]
MLSTGVGFITALIALTPALARHDNVTRQRYSIRMAESIMSRHQGILANSTDRSALLQAGFVQKAFTQLILQYPQDSSAAGVTAYITESVGSVVTTVSNATRDITYPLDRLSSGNGLLDVYNSTGEAKYLNGAEALRSSINLQPRNSDQSLWYYVYPHWGYLDGMYSFAPFLSAYSLSQSPVNTTALDDVLFQLSTLWLRCYHTGTGLLVHGYDASKTAVWASNTTGASQHVWGRSLGWYVMALVDTYEMLPSTPEYRSAQTYLSQIFARLASSLVQEPTRDARSGVWWQVLDEADGQGNYLESSGSSMFVYALLKGVRLGLLQDTKGTEYTNMARRAYKYLAATFVVDEGGRTLGWNGTVGVCSLNSTGTFEYYVGQPLVYNSVLGSAAFVLASLEVERLE